MSLSITASTDKVNCGSDASIDDLQTLTSIAWIWLNPGTTARVWHKGVSPNNHYVNLTTSSLEHLYQRVTTNQNAWAFNANFAAYGRGKWLYIVGVSDPAVSANNKLYMGDLTTAAAEPSAYGTQDTGSGTFNSDTASDLVLGNRSTDGAAFNGKLAWVAMWNRQLSPTEIEEQRLWPHRTSGCVLLHHLGENGLLTQWDKSLSQNNGTVTGCSVADDPPLGRPSDEGFVLMRPSFNASPIVTVW